jgi:hypothetical protein
MLSSAPSLLPVTIYLERASVLPGLLARTARSRRVDRWPTAARGPLDQTSTVTVKMAGMELTAMSVRRMMLAMP